MVGAAGIPIYPGGGRLCLAACPGDGEVKKNCHPPPVGIIAGTVLRGPALRQLIVAKDGIMHPV